MEVDMLIQSNKYEAYMSNYIWLNMLIKINKHEAHMSNYNILNGGRSGDIPVKR